MSNKDDLDGRETIKDVIENNEEYKETAKVFDTLADAFIEEILKKASTIVEAYHIQFEESEDLGFIGNSVELPTVYADGKTKEECTVNLKESMTGAIAYMLENNVELPKVEGQ